jgi:hypothetical protein
MVRRKWLRSAGLVIFVVVGGRLQFLATNTRHPSLLLQVWEVVYGILGLILLVALAGWAVLHIKRGRTMNHQSESSEARRDYWKHSSDQ